jgi:hypothetical protein
MPESEVTMPEVDEPSRARRSGSVPLCAALLGAVCSLWTPGCLNPLPDDQPSYRESAPVVQGPGPGLSGGVVDDPAAPGSGMGESSSGNGEENPLLIDGPQPSDEPLPLPDAGAPEAGVAADDDPEGTIQ